MKSLTITVEEHLAILSIDQPDRRVNTINHAILDEFAQILERVEQDDTIHALILCSAKKDQFITGADIKIFLDFQKPGDALAFSQTGNKLLSRLNGLKKPVIAAIHGPALGGGLEVALACHYRIATDHPSTRFGMSEVKLGLCPGAGGTQRLPTLVGLSEALPLLLKGHNIFPNEAKRIGLVDELVFEHGLLKAARKIARVLAAELRGVAGKDSQQAGNSQQQSYKYSHRDQKAILHAIKSRTSRPAGGNPIKRHLILSQAEKDILMMTRGLLPAPAAILNCVKHGLKHGLEAGLEFESHTFDELAMTPESRQLVHGYFAKQSARKNPSQVKPLDVRRIGILGAGLMGSGITSISIQNGFQVTLKDRNFSSAIHGQQVAWTDLEDRIHKRILTPYKRDRMMSGLRLTGDNRELEELPLIIEAVFEDLSVKQRVLREIEPSMRDEAIFATNTSAIPISEIAKAARRSERVIGMHYFSPVQKMPLLEVVKSDKTSDEAVATACDVGIRQRKYVLVVGDGPGFYVTRIIIPMINEAMLLLEEGADIRIVDTAMKNFGFPIGPVTLVDEAGIDVVAHVNETMHALFQKRGIRIPQALHMLHEAGFAGRKNKRGFYDYRKNKKLINEEVYAFFSGSRRKDFSLKEISERIFLAMLNEAIHCLQDDIIRSPRDGDVGAILGMGFPPFLGGPFRYVDQNGAKSVLDRMEYLHGLYGERFKPAPVLKDHIQNKKRFYP